MSKTKNHTLITVDEAAKRTGYSQEYLRALVKQGQLAAQKRDGKWMIEEAALRAHETRHRGGRKNRLFTPQYVRQHFDRLYLRMPTVLLGFLSLLLMLSIRVSPYFNNSVYTYVNPSSSATMQLVAIGHRAAEPTLASLHYAAAVAGEELELIRPFGEALLDSGGDLLTAFAGAVLFTADIGAQSANLYILGMQDFFHASASLVLDFPKGVIYAMLYAEEGLELSVHTLAQMTYQIAGIGNALAAEALTATEDILRMTAAVALEGARAGENMADVTIELPARTLPLMRALAGSGGR
jgi:excisionase family DNA binding protein